MITVKGVHTSSFIDLRSLFDISSCPELFLFSRLFIIERTISTDIVDSTMPVSNLNIIHVSSKLVTCTV